MIYETLQILKEQLDTFFEEIDLGKIFVLENIALIESGDDKAANLAGKVVITLLNQELETTLRNSSHYKVVNGKTEYKNPPVHLNIFLLISANCETYDKSLKSISKVIQFFQGKKSFTAANTVYNRNNATLDVLDHFKLILELYTPSFEELNYVWGTLGGRQLPSVIYKVQLLEIDNEKVLSKSETISTLSSNISV